MHEQRQKRQSNHHRKSRSPQCKPVRCRDARRKPQAERQGNCNRCALPQCRHCRRRGGLRKCRKHLPAPFSHRSKDRIGNVHQRHSYLPLLFLLGAASRIASLSGDALRIAARSRANSSAEIPSSSNRLNTSFSRELPKKRFSTFRTSELLASFSWT